MDKFEEAKVNFVNGYEQYQRTKDVSETIINSVIPYFETLCCDLEELLVSITEKFGDGIQVLDYVELIFNPKLYNTILEFIQIEEVDPATNYTHYVIILAECVKLERYRQIKEKLLNIGDNDIGKTILHDALTTATNERIEITIERIKSIYMDLINNSMLVNSKSGCDELLKTHNLSFL